MVVAYLPGGLIAGLSADPGDHGLDKIPLEIPAEAGQAAFLGVCYGVEIVVDLGQCHKLGQARPPWRNA